MPNLRTQFELDTKPCFRPGRPGNLLPPPVPEFNLERFCQDFERRYDTAPFHYEEPFEPDREDPLRAARGISLGVAIATFFWMLVAMIGVLIWVA